MSKAFEYSNAYLYLQLLPDPSGSRVRYCGGVNIKRFFPLTKETHGLASNPAFRGLQLLRSKTIVPLVLDYGGGAKAVSDTPCDPTPDGDGWFRETLELTGLSPDFSGRAGPLLVRSLLSIILEPFLPDQKIPEDLSDPAALERFLDGLASQR